MLSILILFFSVQLSAQKLDDEKACFNWNQMAELPIFGSQQEALGVAGAISGISK